MQRNNCIILFIIISLMVGIKTLAHDIEVVNSDGITIYYTWTNNNTELSVSYRGYYYNGNDYKGNIIIPSSVIYDGTTYPVTRIGGAAFRASDKLTGITIPNSVVSISDDAFYGCSSLTTISLPNSVTVIGNEAFMNCSSLANVDIPNTVTFIGDCAFEGTKWYDEQPDGLLYIGKVAYKYKGIMPSNTRFSIQEGIISISENAFKGCSGLTYISMPNSVNSIGDRAFSQCWQLTSITIPNSIKLINSETFEGCSGLTSVSIPNSVTSIGDMAFSGCSNLKNITIPNSVLRIGNYTFGSCYGLTTITIPNSVRFIGNGAFEGTPWYNNQPDGVVYAGKVAYNYKGTMPSNSCIRLRDGTLGIARMAFWYCSNLTSISIPNSTTVIGSAAFGGCSNLTSVILPNSITDICEEAFYRCSGLSAINIPSTVNYIGDLAFFQCQSLISVDSEIANPFEINKDVFKGISSGATLHVPFGTKNKYKAYEGWIKHFSEITETSNTFLLTIKSSGNGVVTYDGTNIRGNNYTFTVSEGTNATISFSADNGYRVKSVKVNSSDVISNVSNNKYTVTNIQSDTSVEVEFENITHTLSIKATGNGSVSYNSTAIRNTTKTFTVNEGTSATTSITPDDGYRIKSVKKGGTDVTSSVTNNKYTVSNIQSDTSVEVEFEAITHTLSIKATGNGSVSYNSTAIRNTTKTFTVNEGTSATISITPDDGFKIKSVKKDGTDVTSSVSNGKYTISNIQSSISVEVEFEVITHTLSIKATGNGSASYNSTTIRNTTKTFTVNEGISATIGITPDDSYRIKSVKKDGIDVTSSVSNNKYTISNIQSNISIEVEFEVVPPTTYTLSIKASGNGSASYNSTAIRNTTKTFTVNEGTSATISIAPDDGFKIKSVKKDGTDVTSSVSNGKYTISNIQSSISVEVEFEVITHTLSIKATGNGSASYNSTTIRNTTKTFTVNEGTSATISITPDDGYRIKSVKKDGTNVTSSVSNNKYTVSNIQSDTSVEVEFENITHTLSIKASGNGSVSYNSTAIRNTTKTFTVNEGTSATISITPDDSYRIKIVKKDGTDVTSSVSNNKYTVSDIQSDTSVEVEFEAITHTVSIKATGNGSASYNSTTIRNTTKSFTLNEGTSATISITPDDDYKIKSVKKDGTDVTSSVSNNSYTISNITVDLSLEVEFESISKIIDFEDIHTMQDSCNAIIIKIDSFYAEMTNGREFVPEHLQCLRNICDVMKWDVNSVLSLLITAETNIANLTQEEYQTIKSRFDEVSSNTDIKNVLSPLYTYSNYLQAGDFSCNEGGCIKIGETTTIKNETKTLYSFYIKAFYHTYMDKGDSFYVTVVPDEGYQISSIKGWWSSIETSYWYSINFSGDQPSFDSNHVGDGLQVMFEPTETSSFIHFADAEVKRICVEHWDTNGDGELSEDEAAAVTDIGRTFEGKNIQNFNELQYFSGITAINNGSFSRCTSLNSITIPSNVTSIGGSAFSRCTNLISITIPDNVTSIGSYAFAYCSGLSTISLSNSLQIIDEWTFCDCSSLAAIIIPSSVTLIGHHSFDGCSGLTSISIPNSVTNIVDGAFYGCERLKYITIPNSVTTIGQYAFYGCGDLLSITIPKSVWFIGEYAFTGCSSLSSIIVDPENPDYDSRENCNAIILSSSNMLEWGCQNTTIPNTIKSIRRGAFSGCRNLLTITIPNSVTSLGTGAFANCTNLLSVFSKIETPFAISSNVFQGIASDAILYVPKGKKEVYQSLSGWSDNFKEIIEETPQSYELSITTTGNGSVSFNSTTIRNTTKTFTVNEGTSATISFTSDNGYHIKSMVVDGIDRTSYISNDQYTVSNIVANISVEVEFEENVYPNANMIISALIQLETKRAEARKTLTTSYADVVSEFEASMNSFDAAVYALNQKYNSWCQDYVENGVDFPASATEELMADINYVSSNIDKVLADAKDKHDTLRKEMSDAVDALQEKLNGVKKMIYEEYELGTQFDTDIIKIQQDINTLGEDVQNDMSLNSESFEERRKEIDGLIDTLQSDATAYYQSLFVTLSVTTTGNGSASCKGTVIRNTTETFLIRKGNSPVITISSDNGYHIKSVKVNNVYHANVESQVTINNIMENTVVEVEFEANPTLFACEGINYSVTSYDDKTVRLAKGNYGKVLEVPATISYMDTEWTVIGVDDDAFDNAEELAAIIWHPEVSINATIGNPNLLLYVNKSIYAPNSVNNVVVNGIASSITLTDAESGNNFYCPQEFTAQHISYSHNYKMTTGIGIAKGWETIALPFDVQTVMHEEKGEIVPFAKWQSGDSTKPFWLMRLEENGWKAADGIKANTPYIISMPNNGEYKDEFLLNGRVTFSSENVTIRKTENMQTASYKGRTFVPTYSEEAMGSGFYVLNVSNDYETNISGVDDGSRFVLNLRKVHPFEAYMITSTNGTRSIDISDGMDDGITEEEQMPMRVYNLKGLMMNTEDGKSMEEIKRTLPSGVYIINGHKMIVK